MKLTAALERSVLEVLGHGDDRPARMREIRAIGSGWHQPCLLHLEDGRRVFLKWSAEPAAEQFEREAKGLEALRAASDFRLPRVLGLGDGEEGPSFLLLEAIDPGPKPRGFFADFGRRLALTHRTSRSWRFGFEHDNFLGVTPQPNGWSESWVEFWRTRRLGFQLALARRNGHSDATLDRLGNRLLERLDALLGEPEEPACLLHGDLWSGNFLCDDHGQVVLVDPAAYRGRREAELAMTRLFGGFDDSFYRAYEEVWPLAPGSEERIQIYQLYHLLNHLNLFGGGYRSQCLAILWRFA